ncbi:MAG: hypothetical protein ACP5N7_06185 [Candidatus Pacearchaeota archaeon]
MGTNKYDIEYSQTNIKNKPVFIFVNHKVGVLCWAKIKELTNKKGNVITFDSHRDFRDGAIVMKKGSSYIAHGSNYSKAKLEHYTKNKEFMDWDVLDEEQNKKIICQEEKFLLYTNDNIFDVAFMKDLIGNVYWYYLEAPNSSLSGKCDDLNGKVHSYIKCNIKRPRKITKSFILDIDLDFFAKVASWSTYELFPEEVIDKYIAFQKELFDNPLCLGVTIALEPDYCGGDDNCLKLLRKVSKSFGLDLIEEGKRLIKKSKEVVT